jgi:hypothetical protein
MTTLRSSDPRDRISPGLAQALRALRLPRRKPTDGDRPPIKPARGRKITPISGQLDLDGNETK